MKYTITIITEELDTVIDNFVKEYTVKDGSEITNREWYIDPFKKVLITKLYIKEN